MVVSLNPVPFGDLRQSSEKINRKRRDTPLSMENSILNALNHFKNIFQVMRQIIFYIYVYLK